MIELLRALRLGMATQVAFVGAGGKSSALFELAKEFEGPVLISTSTHLSAAQTGLGDAHVQVEHVSQIEELAARLKAGTLVVTGALTEEGKATSPGEELLQALSGLARENQIPLLIEADGARGLPLKAPAKHEPAVPEYAEVVVVVAGLSALGQPLNEEFVHRPERFAELSGAQLGDEIQAQHIVQVALHQLGGLKNIPAGARAVLLLNQLESAEQAAAAKRIAQQSLGPYQAVIVAALSPSDGGPAKIKAVHERVAGVLLAGGGAGRFGSAKQLLDWQGKPFVRHIAAVARAAGLDPVVVVSGAYAEEVEAALSGADVQIVHNPDWQQGQSTSVKVGLAALPADVGAAFFLVVDQPQISVELLRALHAEHAASLSPIVAPQIDGQRSNPVLFDRATFADFAAIEGDVGGRAIFSKHRVHWLPWLDAGMAVDVDSPADLAKLLSLYE